jgi:Phosphotransferase enzyme family
MPAQETMVETTEYRLVLVLPESRKILAISDVDGYRLPLIGVPQWTRPAEQLRVAVQTAWKLSVLILDFFDGPPLCAVAEVLVPSESVGFKAVSLEQLQISELSEQQRAQIASILSGNAPATSPFFRVGWIDEAIAWLESETGRKLLSKHDIEQYNGGDSFALVRFHMEDDRDYWLKATGEPNVHEFSITTLLSKLCGSYLPELISSKPEWNAWLMSGEAACVTEVPTAPSQLFTLLEDAVRSMAKLQIQTQGHNLDLLDAGAFDQRMQVFQDHTTELFDYLEEAMSLQTSTKAPRLEKTRIQRLRAVLEEVCQRVEHLAISDTIVHGDLNRGNILTGSGHCQFIDWSEAYLGNPLITLQHLVLLNKVENSEISHFMNLLLKQRYLGIWAESHDPEALDEGLVYMPILATASILYGRGHWLKSPKRNDPRRRSYARSLARHMDRAAREPRLMEALCH